MTTTTDLTGTGLAAISGDYDFDPTHTRIGFAAKHAMVTTVRGQFLRFTGSAHLDGDNPAASYAELSIDPQSISTGVDQRDEHLRGADFFDVEKYGHITFTSTKVEQVDDETFRMTGDLTVRDVTKPVTLVWVFTGAGVDPWGGFRAGFEGSAQISRKEWGLVWNVALETGGILVSDKVKLELDIAAVRRA